jgi:hypothetical protein
MVKSAAPRSADPWCPGCSEGWWSATAGKPRKNACGRAIVIAAPRHDLVRPDKHEIGAVKVARLRGAHVDEGQPEPQALRLALKPDAWMIAQPQQRPLETECIE